MAHFAQLDDNNNVINVIVVNNEDITDEHGNEVEAIGIEFCENLLGGTWLQTSYNRNFRGNFAGIGGTYDPDLDVFLTPKPVSDFVLDDDFHWVPPIPKPDGDLWEWSGKRWRELEEVFDGEGNVCGVQLKEEN
jgi:hypothetical protein